MATYQRLNPETGNYFTSTGEVFNKASFMRRVDGAMSSFDEVSTVSATSLIDLKSTYPLSCHRDRVVSNAGGDVTQMNGEFQVSTTSDAQSSVTFESVEYGRYIAGFDTNAGLGVRLPTRPVGNQFVEFGYTDFNDGVAVGEDSGGVYTALYKGGTRVKKKYRQDWEDPLDNDNGFVFDPNELNIYRFHFRWYGRGPFMLRIAGEDEFDRGVVYTADVLNSDESEGIITENANLPLSVKIDNAGETTPLSVYVAGRQFFILGDYQPERRVVGEYRLEQSVGTDFTPLIAVRKKTGVYRPISVKLSSIEILSTENILWQVTSFSGVSNGTWTNPRLTDNGVESACEFNTTATTISEDGLQFHPGGFVAAGSGNRSGVTAADLPELSFPANDEVITLRARTISGTGTVSSVFNVREEW